MRVSLAFVVAFFATCLALGPLAAQEKKPQTIMGWGTVVDPDGDCKVTGEADKVSITVPKTNHDLTYVDGVAIINSPRVVREVEGDFRVQVKIRAFVLPEMDTSSSGKFSFVGAGLLLQIAAD